MSKLDTKRERELAVLTALQVMEACEQFTNATGSLMYQDMSHAALDVARRLTGLDLQNITDLRAVRRDQIL
jgi:hypothetical protein